jgi:tetratricopeptide (TPR) repeat protein
VKRFLLVTGILLAFGLTRVPLEHGLAVRQRQLKFNQVSFDLGLREQLGQLGFIAAFSGFRAIVADMLFIQAHVAWEQTEWGRVLLLFRQATTLQPHAILFWDMAAWHMGWNASAAAINDRSQPRLALRVKTQREYFALAKDFLQRGIYNNPNRPQLYESLGRLYKDKYNDHSRAAEFFARAAQQPGAPTYLKRFAAYELSYCEGREQQAYEALRRLYDMGQQERLPTLIKRLKVLEVKLGIPENERIPEQATY